MSPFQNILKLEAGEVIFKRGLDLFKENPSKFDIIPIGNIKILNSQINNYDCEIELTENPLKLKNFRCTCPYYQQKNLICKHAVLLALSFEHEISGGLETLQIQSVTELTKYIKTLLEENKLLSNLEVEGEISTFSPNRSGHVYFSIKDENSLLNCVMFKSKVENLSFIPKTGDKIILKGSISLYEPRGSYQLIVNSLKLSGEGDLYAKFLELKKKLEEEGLFDINKKKEIPKIPKKIGVITSQTGAVIQDILNTIKRRFPKIEVQLYPAKVQGEDSLPSLLEGLEYFNNSEVNLIIIARGGGSLEDLWVFNNEKLIRKISSLNKPIISAIGHETDFTLCDFVCDLRAPTPTASAELSTPLLENLYKDLEIYNEIMLKKIKKILEYKQLHFLYLEENIEKKTKQIFKDEKIKIKNLFHKIDLLSYRKVLKRGYSITKDKNGKVITNYSQVKTEEEITTILNNGEIKSIIKK